MTDLHPHWHATADDDGQPIRVSQAKKTQDTAPAQPHITRATRMPAAIVGIVIVVASGVVAVRGWNVVGQLTGSGAAVTAAPAVQVQITASGTVAPSTVTVKPGGEIDFTNNEGIPNILTSATLHDDSGSLMNTPTIFPNTMVPFVVSKNEKPGSYPYSSSIDTRVQGTIVVTAGQPVADAGATGGFGGTLNDVPLPGKPQGPAAAGTPSAASSSDGATTGTAASLPTDASATTAPDGSAPTEAPAGMTDQNTSSAPAPSAIQSNPYTVANAQSAASVPSQGTQPAPLLHAGARPLMDPKTGPEVWVVLLASLGFFAWVVRGYLVGHKKR